ncbi:hypothetical protein C1280_10160 [Gemmata obscuriglobus]|uniref:Uncharacterized protein n=1 Tax=Gemmata obscuriglobus TaxID=114 RepID=A0A2Z3H1A2_9BACT|nr:hypothetical protein C1280_10160 [Gemmata obscuriglobus]
MGLRVVPIRAGAARRRGWRLVPASGGPRHGTSDRWCSARSHWWHAHSGCAALSVRPGTAEVSEPNPALHLTPPSDSGRTAHCIMAVQVSFLFGHPRAHGGRGGDRPL